MADHVEAALRVVGWLEVDRIAHNVVARTRLGLSHRVVLAGHLDTVPPADGNDVPRLEEGTLWGVGAADMKGGLAVMLDLAATLQQPAVDVTYVFYAAEEIAREYSGLLALQDARPDLLLGEAAIVCEPTDGIVEAGCQGVLKALLSVAGRRAHVARPELGVNAIHRLGPVLGALQAWPGRLRQAGGGGALREVVVEGCTYRESLQAVSISGGGVSNVVPDTAEVALNYRFAPDLDVEAAGRVLREVVASCMGPDDDLEIVDSAPAARPHLAHPFLAGLVAAAGGSAKVRGKQGWTDVAFFAERGIPAANFGPGDPDVAHTTGEFVTRASLEHARRVLGEVLSV